MRSAPCLFRGGFAQPFSYDCSKLRAETFCPNCRAEYRPGFARCVDCEVALIEELPPPSVQDSALRENERPDLARTRYFLAWFIPMLVYLALWFATALRPLVLRNTIILIFFICLHTSATFGSFWMLYQAVRYERRVGRYVLLAFVPFMFVWYSLVRVPLRKEFQRDSEFIR